MGQRRTMTVTEVKENHFIKGATNLHLITFKNPAGGAYVAEEASELSVSRFVVGEEATFEITAPGQGNKKDWIKFLAPGSSGTPVISRDHLEVSKTAFSCAVQIGLRENWSEAEILDRATSYANKILIIAQSL